MTTNALVTHVIDDVQKAVFDEVLGDLAELTYLSEQADKKKRHEMLERAEVIIALSFSQKEIAADEIHSIQNTRFIQLIYAGADNIPFDCIPENIVIASNAGAYAGPIAEHVLALALALAKNVMSNDKMLGQGKFEKSCFNQELRGGVCTILGFGGNGKAIATAMQALGMKIFGINRSATTDAPVDFIGDAGDLRKALGMADVVVVTTPLNRETRDLIGQKELEWMKADGILINVGRGAVINQKALYEHLKTHPNFRAGIDTWWSEPADRGELALDYPFFELPNIIGSPHCADHVPRTMPRATRRALENVKRFLLGKAIRGVLDRRDYCE